MTLIILINLIIPLGFHSLMLQAKDFEAQGFTLDSVLLNFNLNNYTLFLTQAH